MKEQLKTTTSSNVNSANNEFIHKMFLQHQLEFGSTKKIVAPKPSSKHDIIRDFKLDGFRDFKACVKKICIAFGTSDSVHRVVKNWKSTKPDPQPYIDYILFANKATNNNFGVKRFCLTMRALVNDYKNDPEGTKNKHKGTSNVELIYHHSLCNYFEEHTEVLNFKHSEHFVRKTLRSNGIFFARSSRSRLMRDKYSAANKVKANNLLARQFKPEGCNFAWVSDITEIEYKPGSKAYICAVRDLYCGSILGWSIDTNMKEGLAVKALENAISKAGTVPFLLHTDGGRQFTGNTYSRFCEFKTINRSISRPGKCLDNAKMETFFANLKTEMSKERDSKGRELKYYTSFDSLALHVDFYMEFYNNERINLADKEAKSAVRKRNLSHLENNSIFSSMRHVDLGNCYIKSLERNTSIYRIIDESNKGMTEEDHQREIRNYITLG